MARGTEFSVAVTPQAYISAAFMLILIPLPWLFAWFVAALVHECCHCAAVALSGKRIYAMEIGVNGAQILTESLSEMETLLCALAGPIGGLLLLLTAPIFPKLAVCGLLQSTYNLLPVYPLDGGRALHSLARLYLQEKTACKVCGVGKIVVLISFIVLGVLAAAVWNLGLLPLLLALLLALRMMKIKIPCK